MSDDTHKTPAAGWWPLGVRSLILLTAAFAVWFAYFNHRAEIERLKPRVASMRSLARELVVADEGKVVAVKHGELWMDDNRWQVYLPEGRYRLNLATRDVTKDGIVSPLKSIVLPAGKRELSLEQKLDGETWRVTVMIDGKKALEAAEPNPWDPGRGSSAGGGFSTSTEFDSDKPVVLLRRRFSRPDEKGRLTDPDGPCEGILLWIEKAR